MKIILASSSPRRKQLMNLLGLVFDIIPSDTEENLDFKNKSILVKKLSLIKAENVYNKTNGDRVVIGSDTIVSYKGKTLTKPKTDTESIKTLKNLSGKSHYVYTGLTVIIYKDGKTKIYNKYSKCKVYFDKISDEEIINYVKSNDPKDKAGSYSIQGTGAKFIKKIYGDYYTVVGLPLNMLYNILKSEKII